MAIWWFHLFKYSLFDGSVVGNQGKQSFSWYFPPSAVALFLALCQIHQGDHQIHKNVWVFSAAGGHQAIKPEKMVKLQRQIFGMASVTVKTNDSDGNGQLLTTQSKPLIKISYTLTLLYEGFCVQLISLQLINLHQSYRQLNLDAQVSLQAPGVNFHFQRLWSLFWAQGGSCSKCSSLAWLENFAHFLSINAF